MYSEYTLKSKSIFKSVALMTKIIEGSASFLFGGLVGSTRYALYCLSTSLDGVEPTLSVL